MFITYVRDCETGKTLCCENKPYNEVLPKIERLKPCNVEIYELIDGDDYHVSIKYREGRKYGDKIKIDDPTHYIDVDSKACRLAIGLLKKMKNNS